MKSYNTINVAKYLTRFNKILYEMKEKMLTAKIINNITIDFIICMIPHHQAAIYMCENLLEFTQYKPLQEIARNIIRTQTSGIEQMKEILNTTTGFENNPREVRKYIETYRRITFNMIYNMQNSIKSNNININFTSEMIPHHMGAVQMCENLLKYYIDPRLKFVAKNIIKEQSKGIKELEEIQKDLCFQKE